MPRVQRNLVEYKASFNKYFDTFLRELQILSKTDMNVKKLYLRLDFNDFYKESEGTKIKGYGNVSIDEEDDFGEGSEKEGDVNSNIIDDDDDDEMSF